MKQIQMLKDAAKGLVIGTALFYITPLFKFLKKKI